MTPVAKQYAYADDVWSAWCQPRKGGGTTLVVILSRVADRMMSDDEQAATDHARWLTYWLGFRGMPAEVETATMDIGVRRLTRASIALPPPDNNATPKRLRPTYTFEEGLRRYVAQELAKWRPMPTGLRLAAVPYMGAPPPMQQRSIDDLTYEDLCAAVAEVDPERMYDRWPSPAPKLNGHALAVEEKC